MPALRWAKTLFPLSEIVADMKNPPKLFFIGNNLEHQKMSYLKESFSHAIPFVKTGCNFLTNFITLSRGQLVEFITEFYNLLFKGNEVAIALKKTRLKLFERYWGLNPSWLCFSLFGSEKFKVGGGD